MGKTSKWLRSFLAGKKVKQKDKENCTTNKNSSVASDQNPSTPILMQPTTPKEKRRWSFRRSSATAAAAAHKDTNSVEAIGALMEPENHEQKKNAMAVAVASAAAAVAAAQAAADMIRLTSSAKGRSSAIEEAAAIKIQSVFRSYLARKALCALKGLVKLQALVRGHLVRKQATATLRCMHALVTVQARARAQRIRMIEEGNPVNHRLSLHRKSTQNNFFRHPYNDIGRGIEENIKIVEMDIGESKGSSKSRHSYSNHPQTEQSHRGCSKQDTHKVSPVPSALTDMSPRACRGHFEDYSFTTAQSSPQYYSAMSKPDPSRVPFAISYDYTFFPNYMANTESWRAKVRSQSAPKQRPDTSERPPSRRRPSMEGRNVPRAMKMQRSSSHVGATAQNYQHPWLVKLDRSAVSLKDSECGSSSTVLTNTNYCRSLVAFDPHGNRY